MVLGFFLSALSLVPSFFVHLSSAAGSLVPQPSWPPCIRALEPVKKRLNMNQTTKADTITQMGRALNSEYQMVFCDIILRFLTQ